MEQAITASIKKLYDVDVDVVLTRPDPQFGDYATNVALQLAGKLGKNPHEIADAIAEELRNLEVLSEVTVAGPGFINLRVSDAVLAQELATATEQKEAYGKPNTYAGKVVVTEYSDPNPFKVLHAGHLYTSVVGDAMSNLIEWAGGTVHRVNFGGDVGLHVAKTLWAIVQELGGVLPENLAKIPEDGRSEWLAARYVEGTAAYEDDEIAQKEIVQLNKQVYAFHSEDDHESKLAQIYWTGREWSYDYFNAFYARIGTKFEKYYPESETAPIGLKTVLEHTLGEPGVTENNWVYAHSGNSQTIIFPGEKYDLHTRVFVNSEGLPTYEAKDVGLSIKKWDDYHFDESVIITGNDITEYMKVVLKSIEQFKPELAERTNHLTHGNVKLAGGVKMSSRKGNFLKAVDVIEIAADENEKAQGNRNDATVLGAIKYAFLKNRVGPDVIFEPRESVGLQGNSGPYLQYSYARAHSIVSSAGEQQSEPATEFDPAERSLLVKLVEYKDVIATATTELAPHTLCTYLYELAQEFNRFYEKSRVIDDPRQAIRLQLVEAYTHVLKSGLNVLGIQTPERM